MDISVYLSCWVIMNKIATKFNAWWKSRNLTKVSVPGNFETAMYEAHHSSSVIDVLSDLDELAEVRMTERLQLSLGVLLQLSDALPEHPPEGLAVWADLLHCGVGHVLLSLQNTCMAETKTCKTILSDYILENLGNGKEIHRSEPCYIHICN